MCEPRFLYKGRLAQERAALLGSAVGSSVILLAFPFVELTLGIPGLHAAILFGLANSLAGVLCKHLSITIHVNLHDYIDL